VLATAQFGAIAAGNQTTVELTASFAAVGTRTLRAEIDGVNSENATANVDVAVSPPPTFFGLDPVLVLAVVVAGSAAGFWFLTPKLVSGRPRAGAATSATLRQIDCRPPPTRGFGRSPPPEALPELARSIRVEEAVCGLFRRSLNGTMKSRRSRPLEAPRA